MHACNYLPCSTITVANRLPLQCVSLTKDLHVPEYPCVRSRYGAIRVTLESQSADNVVVKYRSQVLSSSTLLVSLEYLSSSIYFNRALDLRLGNQIQILVARSVLEGFPAPSLVLVRWLSVRGCRWRTYLREYVCSEGDSTDDVSLMRHSVAFP